MVEVGLRFLKPLDPFLIHRRRYVVTLFAALAFAGAALLPHLGFDSDPLHTKDPNSEAVRTLEDLANDPITDPYTIDILAPSTEQAAALGARIAQAADGARRAFAAQLRAAGPGAEAALHPGCGDACCESTLNPGPPPPPPDRGAAPRRRHPRRGRARQGARQAAAGQRAAADHRRPADAFARARSDPARDQHGDDPVPAGPARPAARRAAGRAGHRGRHPARHQARTGSCRMGAPSCR